MPYQQWPKYSLNTMNTEVNEQISRLQEKQVVGEVHQQNIEKAKKNQSPSFRFRFPVPARALIGNSISASQPIRHPTGAVEKQELKLC